jgi:hypothetical protein
MNKENMTQLAETTPYSYDEISRFAKVWKGEPLSVSLLSRIYLSGIRSLDKLTNSIQSVMIDRGGAQGSIYNILTEKEVKFLKWQRNFGRFAKR